jgi:uridine monophosphate synthetase
LVPGVGAQGGELAAALHAGLRADGLGVLLTVSRSIAEANDPAAEAARLQNEINALRKTNAGRATAPAAGLQALAAALHASGCVKFGEFTLKSGQQSPIYIDLRRLASFPAALQTVALALLPLLRTLSFQRIAAIPYAALPIGTAVALAGSFSLIYPRREAKAYGTRANIEGEWQPGETAVVLDDLITSGLSKLETIAQLQSAGLVVKDIVVLIDRSNDSAAALAGTGCRLQAAATIRQLLDEWLRAGAVDSSQHAKVLRYIAAAPAG